MEVKNVRCCDTAALVALINMLKVNLSSTPEIYKTLLAVLCDFDPCKLGSRDRTVRYIRLLITDKVLANCLLMSLPQASEELQNLPFYTGSLPDMRRALKQKFQGMKVSVQSPKRRSEEPSSVPADALNQNITVIVTDQDQTKLIAVDETNDPNIVQTELDPCSPFHGRNKKTTATTIPSSQPKPVITFTKSSIASSSQDTLAMMNLSMPVINNATNQPPVTLILDAQSQSSAAKVSKNASQSRLDDLVALVKSRSNSKHNAVQDCVTTSAEVPVTNVYPRPVYYAGSDMNYSLLWGQREQPFSQNCKQNSNPVSQARLQTPLVPLLYQPYTYPVQGSASYQSCLAGYAANSLLPWTPLTYFQGYTPNPHYPTAPLHFGQLSSTSGIDATLDLSLKKKPESQTQSRHSDNNGNSNENNKKKTSQKRSASVSTVLNENEILQPKQKVRKTSTETPERSMSPYIKETAKCQPALNKTATYLSSGDDRKSIDERPNSLKALQELTLRIDGNTGVSSTQSQNLLSSRKFLSTGSITDTLKQAHVSFKQKVNEKLLSKNLDIIRSTAVLKHYAGSSSQKSALPGNNFASNMTTLIRPANVSDIKLLQPDTGIGISTVETDPGIDTSYPSKQVTAVRDEDIVQLHGEPKVSHSAYYTEQVSNFKNKKALESEPSLSLSNNQQNRPVCMRSFPYSQHIQLPDGNISTLDFPALLSLSSTNSVKSSSQFDKSNVKGESVFHYTEDSSADVSDTSMFRNRPNETLTSDNGKDYASKYSLYLKKSDISSETEGNIQPKSVTPSNKGQENVAENETSKSKETCLIIETTSENGTEQVEFKLDKKRSANLLGELLKFKPLSHTDHERIDSNSKDSQSTRSLSNDGQKNSYQRVSELNNQTERKDDVYKSINNYQSVPGNIDGVTNSETESSFSSLNVSPYLFGMLPDTTTLIDDDEKNDGISNDNDDFTDCDDGDDDVFLHPIF